MFLLLFILLFTGLSPAQDSNIDKYQFISPLPGSKLIMPENNIIIRQGDIVDPTTIKEVSIEVVGSISGLHSGEFFLSDDMRTLIFIPLIHFTPGEKVNVKLYSGIYTTNRDMLSPINFDFYISQTLSNDEREKVLVDVLDLPYLNLYTKNDTYFLKSNKAKNEGLPKDFPDITVITYNNPSEGFIFLSPRTLPLQMGYLIIMDNDAIPIYYHRTPSGMWDFKVQINGLLSYADNLKHNIYLMNSSYRIIDSVRAGNGYLANNHEFQILPNGHYLLMVYDQQPVRMDTIVVGGDSSAIVIGLIIQELDLNKNVVFQWRSWDHYQITDATEDIDLTQHTIDYVHGNAIELDFDGNLLISSRHMFGSDWLLGRLDLSEPETPTLLGKSWYTGYGEQMALRGNLALVADYQGIAAVDVGRTDQVLLSRLLATTAPAAKVHIKDSYAFAFMRAGLPVVEVKLPDKNTKEELGNMVAPEFESGRALIPEWASWLEPWLEEHKGFPYGLHDDWVETTIIALWYLFRARPFNRPRALNIYAENA